MARTKSFDALKKEIKKTVKKLNTGKKVSSKKKTAKKKSDTSYTVVGYTKTGKPIKKKLMFRLF
jgi:hypothetical protein